MVGVIVGVVIGVAAGFVGGLALPQTRQELAKQRAEQDARESKKAEAEREREKEQRREEIEIVSKLSPEAQLAYLEQKKAKAQEKPQKTGLFRRIGRELVRALNVLYGVVSLAAMATALGGVVRRQLAKVSERTTEHAAIAA